MRPNEIIYKEDKLSSAQRIRLEALAQANQTYFHGGVASADDIVATAAVYEKYIREGVSDGES